jgi:uncharacterized protein YbbC (DUF1343 family)
MKFGIDRIVAEPSLRAPLKGRRVALLAHPASVTPDLTHSLDALATCGDMKVTAAFGPQHGLRGDKQDNMIESPDFVDPTHGIPVFSLYGQVRKPTNAMMDTCDVILVDLQDLGCRIYTFLTTLRYVLEAASKHRKAVWVLDRPNPAGRPVEGLTLRAGWQSFVGAGPLPMRHGLTLGELGQWFIKTLKLDIEYRVVELQGWQPDASPGFGWPLGERTWINPSPNGFTDAGCAIAGSNPRFTNMSVSCATACRFTRKVLNTIIRRSSLGVCRRSLSKLFAGCIPTILSGAILPTSTNRASSPSMSSMAVRCSGIGWTMHVRRRKI